MKKNMKVRLEYLLNKKLTVVLFRWITILITSILLYYKRGAFNINDPAVLLLLFLTFSNGVIIFLKKSIFDQPKYIFLILLADIISISILFRFISSENYLYLVFFAVLFISSISQNIKWSVFIAMIASIFYLSTFTMGKRIELTTLLTNPKIAIKIPFIFLTAIWTSFWSEQYKRKKEEEEKIKKFNKELEEGIKEAIAKEKIVLEELKETKEYSENILKSLSSGVVVVDKEGLITTINPKAETILDVSLNNTILRYYNEINELKPFYHLINSFLENGQRNGFHEINLKNGKILSITISPLKESQQENGATIVFNDITAVKKMKEKIRQSESLANLGKTVAWIAHEIRNSLTNIIGYAQLIEIKFCENEELKRLISPLIYATETISAFMNDILDFSKNRILKKEIVDVKSLFAQIKSSYKNSLNGTKLLISQDNTNWTLFSNQEALKCVISNLIRNAKESIEDNGGFGTIELTSKRLNNHCVFEVIDSGTGMDANTVQSIFNPFYTTKKNGTGLGLSIVKKVVESLDGEISVHSTPGVGTRFALSIPIKNEEAKLCNNLLSINKN